MLLDRVLELCAEVLCYCVVCGEVYQVLGSSPSVLYYFWRTDRCASCVCALRSVVVQCVRMPAHVGESQSKNGTTVSFGSVSAMWIVVFAVCYDG